MYIILLRHAYHAMIIQYMNLVIIRLVIMYRIVKYATNVKRQLPLSLYNNNNALSIVE